ncbi:hypothetical protein [Adhaeretor mobilis]|uniref:Uncharacterized protein n=1 Tax=Adhaeretor mobilis TaxID=1930276 RepID=A0A517MX92_9BACT|nr:hypothetical protein [Adhaeretor mobilis]QDS99427.1 hypothetical protein HG15A2_27500 [Adhaeretor mobilis]
MISPVIPLAHYTVAISKAMVLAAMLVFPFQSADAELSFEPTWQVPSAEDVSQELERWAAEQDLSKEQQEQLDSLWSEGEASDDLLTRTVASCAIADLQVAKLMETCSRPYSGPKLPDIDWLNSKDRRGFLTVNISLYYARWLAQHRLYDETIAVLKPLRVEDVVDPAALLFYRAVAYQQIVKPDMARAELVRLLEREDDIPRRYQQVARLLERDLANLDDQSLNHIAKRMDDVGRRLSLGRAGKQVQMIEDGVLGALDRLIRQAEEQQKQQQQSSSSQSQQSSKPMEDSRPAELKAPGRVDAKDIGRQAGWGDLPPREREQALQQIGRDFPAHYREVIEEYFRELATESNQKPASQR